MTVNPQKARRTKLIFRPSLFAFVLTLLLIVVAIFLLVRRPTPIVDGVSPVISVVHVQGNMAGRRQQGVFALRDNAYIKTDEHVGFMSLTSRCRQSAKATLPRSFSLELAKYLVGSQRLQRAYGAPNGRDSWYVRVHDGQAERCYAISNDDAKKYAEVAAVVKWFEGIQEDGAPLNVTSCGGDPDFVYQLCKPKNNEP